MLMCTNCYKLLRRLFQIVNFCFWVPSFNQLLLRNCAVDFVEICKVCARKVIIKVAQKIFHSDKIWHSYCDFYFGVTFHIWRHIFWNTVNMELHKFSLYLPYLFYVSQSKLLNKHFQTNPKQQIGARNSTILQVCLLKYMYSVCKSKTKFLASSNIKLLFC